MRLTAVLTVLVLVPAGLAAQQLGYREHLRLAERFGELGEHLKSAEQYARAYAARPKKEEYAFEAAENFFLVKDYARAAEHYAVVKRDWGTYPLAGLRYARALKQDARFEEAVAAYKDYLSYYRGDDLPIVRKIVEGEVRGAAMAQQSLATFAGARSVRPFPPTVNGPDGEAAPMPLSAGAVYFLTDRDGGFMRMYRTLRTASGWQPGEVAAQFPVVPGKHIGSGSLNPTGSRFYFGLCDGREVATQPTARCRIYVIERDDGRWTTPQPLPSYINTDDNSTAHPYLYREGENEVMLFASDRLDGYGGMDLYRCERPLDSEGTDFTFPENLGPVVNGVGDEVSPHYDPQSQLLHFASNGYVNMGGYDVFRTIGGRTGWNVPENLGAPVNSPADDYYYRPIPGTPEAVLSSNRAVRDAKTRTSNEDLFHVRPGAPLLTVGIQVIDSATAAGLGGVTIAAFTRDGDRERLITNARSEDSFFDLELPVGTTVELRAQREGYHEVIRRVDVPDRVREGFQVPRIRMRRVVVTLADVQELESDRTEPASGRLPTAQPTRTARPQQASPAVVAARTPAPASRVAYRVQIEARLKFEPYHPRYADARAIGELTSDFVPGSPNLYRVLLGDFGDLRSAEEAMRAAQRAGWRDAFVAKLEGGVYRGAVR